MPLTALDKHDTFCASPEACTAALPDQSSSGFNCKVRCLRAGLWLAETKCSRTLHLNGLQKSLVAACSGRPGLSLQHAEAFLAPSTPQQKNAKTDHSYHS